MVKNAKPAKSGTTAKPGKRAPAAKAAKRAVAAQAPAAPSVAQKDKTVTLTDNTTGKSYTYKVLDGTIGPQVIDIRSLYADTGMFTYDPGFTSTGSCESQITYIDGDAGVLLYRGYPIEDIVEKCDFVDTCYLLLNGELPTGEEKKKFNYDITHHSMVHEQLAQFYRGFRRDAHPMAVMCGVVGGLAAFYHDSTDITDARQRTVASYRLIAKMPTIAAWAYKYSVGQPFVYPTNSMQFAENFLHMLFAVPAERYDVSPVFAKAMDRILILHADHEQNASTSTVRLAGSSDANPFACIAAGIASLWGPAHGGANEAVLKMLAEIGDKKNIPEFIKSVKEKKAKLMGFGHRVYKNFDPRAKVMARTCREVLDELGRHDDPMLALAVELEKIALNDQYFIDRKLYPNVDFYSGIIFRAMGIPVSMFTPLFAVARTVGWVSQWNEMISDPGKRIGRPRQLYNGSVVRKIGGAKK